MSAFQLVGLAAAPFEHLFTLTADELRPFGAHRVKADSKPGFPCRIGLTDAEPGDELLLLPFEHQPASSPYRASGPIFVRVGATERTLAIGEVPAYVATRQISLRAYDGDDWMVEAEVIAGTAVGPALERLFDDPRVSYVHLHNAKRGCFSCRARRANA